MSILNNVYGLIKLTAPLHCSAGSDSNVTRITKQTVVIDGGRVSVPYFPSNDLRGRLRRKAAKRVIDQLVNEEKLKPELVSGLLCGAVSANPESNLTVEEVIRARQNVYMGLFGGGTRMMRSAMKTHDMLPICKQTIQAGMINRNLLEVDKKEPSVFDLQTSQTGAGRENNNHTHYRRDDIYLVNDLSLLAKAFDDVSGIVGEHQSSVAAQRLGRKNDGDSKTDLSNIMEWEAINAGTEMTISLDFEDYVSDAQIGLALLSLVDLFNENALGGMTRLGWGAYQVTQLRGVFGGTQVNTNLIEIDPTTGIYQLAAPVQHYADAANEEIARLSIADMWAFFERTEKKAE